MSTFKYPNLFKPIKLGNTLFRNRIFASPTGYQNMTGNNILPEGAEAYYERKALGGAASVASCELIVDGELGRGGANHVCLDDPSAINPLCRIANAVAKHGAIANAELQHTGMYANRDLSFFGGEAKGLAYGPVEFELDGRIVKEMPEDIIEHTIAKYAQAARIAKQCGFGMILIHAGHGWLLHQFLSPQLNTRKDKWGGAPVENRARLLLSVCDAVRKEVGAGFPIEVRISGSECYDGGFGLDDGIAFAKQLDGHCDLIHVSAGSHEVDEVFSVTHPSMFLEDGCNVKYAAEIKKHVKTPVATIGALGDPELMEDIIASGKADVVEMARSLLADPDLPIKIRTGREQKIKPCMRCLACFSSELSVGEPYCAVNPETGRELEMKYDFPKVIKSKKVLIVGGGIAGMEAALTCMRRGHEVVLCEKSDTLGGAIRCEKNVPFKQKLDLYLNRQERDVKNSAIDLRMNTEVTPEFAKSIGADVIIACTGAKPIKPGISGIDGKNVLGAEYAYVHPEEVGNNVAILGAGLVGLELAVYLSMIGRKVTIVEMMDRMNDGGNFLHMPGLTRELRKYQVDVNLNTKATDIKENGVSCETADGEKFFTADTVIYAVGQAPLMEEASSLAFCAPEFYQIGDCLGAKNITNATSSAFAIARDIGRI